MKGRSCALVLAVVVATALLTLELSTTTSFSLSDRFLNFGCLSSEPSQVQEAANVIQYHPTLPPPDFPIDEKDLEHCPERIRQAREEACQPFKPTDPSPRILVTGGAGFIGSQLVKRMKSEGVTSLKIIDNLWRGRLSSLCDRDCSCPVDLAADFCFADLTNNRASTALFNNAEVVYHLADVIAGVNFVFSHEHWLFQQNELINANVLQAALLSQTVTDYIYVGSACSFPLELQSGYNAVALREDQTYPAHPESAYGWSKLMGEYSAGLILKMKDESRHSMRVGLLRFHNVYGPFSQYADKSTSQALPALVRKAIHSPKLEKFQIWGSSRQYRDFVFVDDVVETLLRVRVKGMNQGVIQVGTGEVVTLIRAAGIIQDLTKTCLGKELSIETDTSRPEGDGGRAAVRDRAQQILSWEASVFIEEGLARLFAWVVEDMSARGQIESWMFGATNKTAAEVAECLKGEGAKSKRSEPLKLPAQVPQGQVVWKQGPTSLMKQLGAPPVCEPGKQQDLPKGGTGTLVIIICSTRGHHLTWRNFNDHVLKPLKADLALAVTQDSVSGANSFVSNAKYVWAVSDPPEDDYRYWFNEIAEACFGRKFSDQDAETLGKVLRGHWLGLIRATKHRTASSILIFFRWLALQHIVSEGLLGLYQHFIITRSDYFFIADHPPLTHAKSGTLIIPNGEGYGGVTDRHTVIHAADVPRVLSLAEKLVFGSGQEVADYWMGYLGQVGANGLNTETVLDTWYRKILNLKVSFCKLVMFIIFDPEDQSIQRAGEHYTSSIDPYLVSQIHVKYYTEYNTALAQVEKKETFQPITDKQMQELGRNRTLEKEARERREQQAQALERQRQKELAEKLKAAAKAKQAPAPAASAAVKVAPPPPSSTIPGSGPLVSAQGKICFALPPGDEISSGVTFTPPLAEALTSPDATREPFRLQAHQLIAGMTQNCSCEMQRFQQCPHGVGSSLSSMLKPMTAAIMQGAPWDFEAPRKIPAAEAGLQRFCPAHDLATPGVKCKEQVSPGCHYWHWKPIEVRVPEQFQSMGLFWWTAQQWTWLLRPSAEVAAKVNSLKEAWGWEDKRPILGMHVRHGDSCMSSEGGRTGRKCEGIEVYMQAMSKMDQYNYKTIFLATDDLKVANEAKEKYPQYNWLIGSPSASQMRNQGDGWKHRFEELAFEKGGDNMDLKTEFKEVLSDILLLSDVDGFIGKFTSNVDRISYALNYGRRGCAVPFASLDAYWCNDYGLETGHTIQGAKFAC
mmetsp:Transcript_89758/g.187528  ORF Transcript_89758/g.187528 Transcript_89758/m.187528 type:complete len:1250 (-) Transcript_89758:81-3830(-)